MKLMPASRALATIRDDVASSVGPPNIMVPRQIGEIFRPLRPRLRYCIGWVLCTVAVIPGRIEDANPESRDSGSGPSDHPGMTVPQLSLFKILNTPLAIAIQRLSTVTSVVMKIRLRVERTTCGFDTRSSPILPA